MLERTLSQARHRHRSAQGLLTPASGPATAAALRNCFIRMRWLGPAKPVPPVQDIALHCSYKRAGRKHQGLVRGQHCRDKQRAHLDRLLDHITGNAPVKSSDFERSDGRSAGWCGWNDEKPWLEARFATGELMVAKRENFQHVYDTALRGLATNAVRAKRAHVTA